MAFDPVTFFCEKRGGYSKRDRMEIIDLHPKRVFDGDVFSDGGCVVECLGRRT